MDVMNSPTNTVKVASNFARLLEKVSRDFPKIEFKLSDTFCWSDEDQSICYDPDAEHAIWSLLHELGHMHYKHDRYTTDVMLVRMEVEAWEKAKELGSHYDHAIDEDHIQDCIDSYRNWQHRRSTCPECEQTGIEKTSGTYLCINCRTTWKVTANRFCRVYRQRLNHI